MSSPYLPSHDISVDDVFVTSAFATNDFTHGSATQPLISAADTTAGYENSDTSNTLYSSSGVQQINPYPYPDVEQIWREQKLDNGLFDPAYGKFSDSSQETVTPASRDSGNSSRHNPTRTPRLDLNRGTGAYKANRIVPDYTCSAGDIGIMSAIDGYIDYGESISIIETGATSEEETHERQWRAADGDGERGESSNSASTSLELPLEVKCELHRIIERFVKHGDTSIPSTMRATDLRDELKRLYRRYTSQGLPTQQVRDIITAFVDNIENESLDQINKIVTIAEAVSKIFGEAGFSSYNQWRTPETSSPSSPYNAESQLEGEGPDTNQFGKRLMAFPNRTKKSLKRRKQETQNFPCYEENCSKKLKSRTSSGWKKHYQYVHFPALGYVCPVCFRSFTRPEKYRDHFNNNHPSSPTGRNKRRNSYPITDIYHSICPICEEDRPLSNYTESRDHILSHLEGDCSGLIWNCRCESKPHDWRMSNDLPEEARRWAYGERASDVPSHHFENSDEDDPGNNGSEHSHGMSGNSSGDPGSSSSGYPGSNSGGNQGRRQSGGRGGAYKSNQAQGQPQEGGEMLIEGHEARTDRPTGKSWYDSFEVVIRRLGEGGFGKVDMVHVVSMWYYGLSQAYARKNIQLCLKCSPKELPEVEILSRLEHAHIIKLVNHYVFRGRAYFLMSPVAKSDLRAFLHMRLDHLIIRRLRLWFSCLSSAVEYLHDQGIIHGDIKPTNILVCYSSDMPWKVFLSDFGSARRIHATTNNCRHSALTPKYAAPELYHKTPTSQQSWSHPLNRSADVFSLGCVFLEMATVICGYSMRDFEKFRLNGAGCRPFHESLAGTMRWIDVLRDSGGWGCRHLVDYLNTITDMLNPDPSRRPTAKEVSKRFPRCTCELNNSLNPEFRRTFRSATLIEPTTSSTRIENEEKNLLLHALRDHLSPIPQLTITPWFKKVILAHPFGRHDELLNLAWLRTTIEVCSMASTLQVSYLDSLLTNEIFANGLQEVLERPSWSRLWTIQEMQFISRVMICSGLQHTAVLLLMWTYQSQAAGLLNQALRKFEILKWYGLSLRGKLHPLFGVWIAQRLDILDERIKFQVDCCRERLPDLERAIFYPHQDWPILLEENNPVVISRNGLSPDYPSKIVGPNDLSMSPRYITSEPTSSISYTTVPYAEGQVQRYIPHSDAIFRRRSLLPYAGGQKPPISFLDQNLHSALSSICSRASASCGRKYMNGGSVFSCVPESSYADDSMSSGYNIALVSLLQIFEQVHGPEIIEGLQRTRSGLENRSSTEAMVKEFERLHRMNTRQAEQFERRSRFAEAEFIFRAAVGSGERVLGHNNPRTILCIFSLARVLDRTRENQEVHDLYVCASNRVKQHIEVERRHAIACRSKFDLSATTAAIEGPRPDSSSQCLDYSGSNRSSVTLVDRQIQSWVSSKLRNWNDSGANLSSTTLSIEEAGFNPSSHQPAPVLASLPTGPSSLTLCELPNEDFRLSNRHQCDSKSGVDVPPSKKSSLVSRFVKTAIITRARKQGQKQGRRIYGRLRQIPHVFSGHVYRHTS